MQTGCPPLVGAEVRVQRVNGALALDFVGSPAPDLARVAQRARVLAAVAYRGWSEARESGAAQQRTAQRLLEWLGVGGALAALEADEERVMRAPPGELPEGDRMRAAWRIEGAAVLAWAARALRMPGPDELVKLADLVEAIEHLPRARPELAPRSEGEVLDLMARSMDALDATAGEDPQFENHEISVLARCAFERAKAARWLVGLAPTYAETWVPLRRAGRRLA